MLLPWEKKKGEAAGGARLFSWLLTGRRGKGGGGKKEKGGAEHGDIVDTKLPTESSDRLLYVAVAGSNGGGGGGGGRGFLRGGGNVSFGKAVQEGEGGGVCSMILRTEEEEIPAARLLVRLNSRESRGEGEKGKGSICRSVFARAGRKGEAHVGSETRGGKRETHFISKTTRAIIF